MSFFKRLFVIFLVSVGFAACQCKLEKDVFPITNFTDSLYVNTIGNWQSDNGSMSVYARDGDNPNFVNMAAGPRSFWYSLIREPWTDICMDVTRFQYVQIVIRDFFLDSFQIFFTCGYDRDCYTPAFFTSYSLTPNDFETQPDTNLLEANIPLSQFNPPLDMISVQAVALVNLNPGGRNLTVVSLSLVGVKSECNNVDNGKGFVWKKDSTLMLGPTPFRFLSYNAPFLFSADAWEQLDLIKTAAIFADGGSAVLRSPGIIQVGSKFSINTTSALNENWFLVVDRLLKFASDNNVKVIIPLIERVDYLGSGNVLFGGGIPAFVALFGSSNENDFYTSNSIKTSFKNILNLILNRVNTLNKRVYKSDPSILAWELGNGLKPSNKLFPPSEWIKEISSYIKSVDINHLIFDGSLNDGKNWHLSTMMIESIDGLTQFFSTDSDFGAACKNARSLAYYHKKAYIISSANQISLKRYKSSINSCFDQVFSGISDQYYSSAVNGALLCCLGGRKIGKGFYTTEYPSNLGTLFHHPGFQANPAAGISPDELSMMIYIAGKANTLKAITASDGLSKNELNPFIPSSLEPPTIYSAVIDQKNNQIEIKWFGSVGSTSFSLSRSFDGVRFDVVSNEISEFFNVPLFDKSIPVPLGKCNITVFYRMIALGANALKSAPFTFVFENTLPQNVTDYNPELCKYFAVTVTSKGNDNDSMSIEKILTYAGIALGVLVISTGFAIWYYLKGKSKYKMVQSLESSMTRSGTIISQSPYSSPRMLNFGAANLITGGMAGNVRLDPKVDYEKKYYEHGEGKAGATMSMTLGNSVNAVAIPGYLMINLNEDVDYRANDDQSLGSGGTASIYLGKLKSSELIEKYGKSQVAVKILKEKLKDQTPAQHEEIRRNFLYEVALMSSLPPSPYIVQLIGFSEDPRGIVMKYYPLSLKSLLRDPDFDCSPMIALKIAADIANGMNLIHKCGILHLDMKPHNVLVDIFPDQSFNCVICDFGFANLIGRGNEARSVVSGLQVPTTAGLTIRYAAPELFERIKQARVRFNSEQDKKIDVYAYSIAIYEVVAQVDAWPGLSVSEIEKNVRAGNRPEIKHEVRDRFKDVKKLIDMVEKTWSHDPYQRPGFVEISQMLNDECSQIQGNSRSVNTTTETSRHDMISESMSEMKYDKSQTFTVDSNQKEDAPTLTINNDNKSQDQSNQGRSETSSNAERQNRVPEDAPTLVVAYEDVSNQESNQVAINEAANTVDASAIIRQYQNDDQKDSDVSRTLF